MTKTDKLFPIGYVSRVTGLTTHVIRVWEKRYAVVTPHRSPGNRRLYSQDDVRRLSLLQRAVTAGQNISNAVRMDDRQLSKITAPTPHQRMAPERIDDSGSLKNSAEKHLKRCLTAVTDMDVQGLESALRQAAVDLPRLSLLIDVISILFERIGKLWADGSIRIVHEHLASNVAQGFLWEMFRSSQPANSSPAMVVATPSGQWCQIGALMAAIAASDAGWEAHYFGPNLPAEEIAVAAKQKRARYIALSITFSGDRSYLIRELKKLRNSLQPDVEIVFGGRGSNAYRETIEAIGARRFKDIRGFFELLNTSPSQGH